MTVIIPLAGLGTRLRPLTYSIPKPLLKVAGSTIIGWILKSISSLPINKVVLIIGYRGEEIREWVKNEYPELNVQWVVQENKKGLGHAVWMAGEKIPLKEDVLIYLGDTIFDVDWEKIGTGDKWLIAVKEVEDPERFGIVKIKDNKIIDMVEKPKSPPSNLAVVGLYYIKEWGKLYYQLNRLIKDDIKTNNEYQLTDGLRMLLQSGVSLEPLVVNHWFDCGTRRTLLQTNAQLLENYEIDNVEGFNCISDSAKIRSSSIGPYVMIGNDSVIEDSVIKNSIIGNKVHIKNSKLTDSILGDRVEIEDSNGIFYLGDDSVIDGKEDK